MKIIQLLFIWETKAFQCCVHALWLLFWHCVKMLLLCSRSQITVGVSWYSVESVVSASLRAESKSLNVASEQVVREAFPLNWSRQRVPHFFLFLIVCFNTFRPSCTRFILLITSLCCTKVSELALSQPWRAVKKQHGIMLIFSWKSKPRHRNWGPALSQSSWHSSEGLLTGPDPALVAPCSAVRQHCCATTGNSAGSLYPGTLL